MKLTTLSAPLSLVENGGVLPSEFRIFRAGVNDSTKGPVIFDDLAAASVMAAFAAHGADVHIDLEHLALDSESVSYDPDARGWARLGLRDGELWAVDVRWTSDGARRLREKTQRYPSPAFYVDEDGRVKEIINIALTGLPATHKPAALVAASRLRDQMKRTLSMTAELAEKAMAAIAKGDEKAALAILTEQMTSAAAGGEVADEPAADPVASDAEPPPEEMSETPDPEKEEELAAIRSIRALTRCDSVSETLSMVKEWSVRIAEVAAREHELELSERRALTADLVKLGCEHPSTAWEGDPKDRKPAARLMSEDLAGFRSRVKILKMARGNQAVTPPRSQSQTSTLSAAEIAECKKRNIDPETFAARKLAAVRRTS